MVKPCKTTWCPDGWLGNTRGLEWLTSSRSILNSISAHVETLLDRLCDGKPKVLTLRYGGDDAVAETPPWNLRTRQTACNELGDESPSITGVKSGKNEGGGDGDSQKLKFSVSLLMEEIEKDFTVFVGKNSPKNCSESIECKKEQHALMSYDVPEAAET
ncbi:hypothetical protein Bca4012_061461 [Brassica carinata]